MKKILVSLLTLPLTLFLSACSNNPILENKSIWHDLEFGGVYIDVLISDFNKLGFLNLIKICFIKERFYLS